MQETKSNLEEKTILASYQQDFKFYIDYFSKFVL